MVAEGSGLILIIGNPIQNRDCPCPPPRHYLLVSTEKERREACLLKPETLPITLPSHSRCGAARRIVLAAVIRLQ